MAYAQDTIISANAADDFVTVLQGLLTDAGWTNVETITPSGTYRTAVWLSDGDNNQAGYDWYCAILWNTIGTEQAVEVIYGVAYDVGLHRIYGIPASLTSAGASGTGTANFNESVTGYKWGYNDVNRTPSGGNIISPHGASSGTQRPWVSSIIPSSAFGYWASVTLDHITAFTTTTWATHGATLDVDPAWPTYPIGGGAPNPIVSIFRTANVGIGEGISAGVIGTGTTNSNSNYRNDQIRRNSNIGLTLPALTGTYMDAYAWRAEYALCGGNNGISGNGSGWDNPSTGEGALIGTGIDYYHVLGGDIGDTVTIDGATYVLSGLISTPVQPQVGPMPAYIAVLVE